MSTTHRPRDHAGPRLTDYLVLGVAAGHWPLGVMAGNHWQVVHPERIIALVLVVGLLAGLVALFLTRVGVRRLTATFVVFLATIMFMRGGQILRDFEDPLAWLIVGSPVLLAAVVSTRFGDHLAIRVTLVALTVTLASGPLISLYLSLQEPGLSQVLNSQVGDVELVKRPNVFLVVFDGYPGLQALEREFGQTKEELISELRERGFQVPESAWTSYWSTELALPSILQMAYPVEEGSLNSMTRQHLHQIIGGDSQLVEILESNGYETVMVESGWTGSSCGEAFDRCVVSPWLDDQLFYILWEGVTGESVLASNGHAYTKSTQATMSWLRTLVVDTYDTVVPTFVFAHLIAPHGPFYLSNSCQTVVSGERFGDRFYVAGVDRATRERFFFDHMQCVDGFMKELADSVKPGDVVILLADHGTGRRESQLDGGVQDWAAVIERMNVFVAVRMDADCELGDSLVTPNLIRRVLSCYATNPVEELPSRIFLPGMRELASDDVERLVAQVDVLR